MKMEVPKEILSGLDEILSRLSESRRVKSYKFLIGSPQGAQAADFDDSGWKCSREPVKYDRHQGVTWFRFEVRIPEAVLGIPVSGSAVRLSTLFFAPVEIYVDGALRFSETAWMDFKNPEIILTEHAAPGAVFQVAARLDLGELCYYSREFSMSVIADRVEDCEFELSSFRSELLYAARFEEVREILPEVFGLISDSLARQEGVMRLIEKIRRSREMLAPMKEHAKRSKVHLVGHAHIDMNWFWSMEETRDVVRRDFATMTRIMEEVPEFRFSQSQCATYDMAERLCPETFEKMKRFISSGNWDVTASTWVEGDMNLSSGEAIARHILYSKKYLREKFGVEPRIMWCPDTFGHSANVPQICSKAGIRYYYFMRCGRGTQDGAAYTCTGAPLFWWEGIDGTRVLAFNGVYNADMNTAGVLDVCERMEDGSGLKNAMFVYGTGDHGGGPTRRDIRRAQQISALATMPMVEFSTTHAFFDSAAAEQSPCVPVEKGEINFVFEGCYTTHADIKKCNRMSENALADTEALCSAALLLGWPDDSQEREKCWKATLFNQFHDIFDGSGVKASYEYSVREAQAALRSLNALEHKNLQAIGKLAARPGRGAAVLLFNATGWERPGCVRLDLAAGMQGLCGAADASGTRLPSQPAGGGLYVDAGVIPAMGYRMIYLNDKPYAHTARPVRENGGFYELETDYYTIEIKKCSGEITTLYDKKNGRYVVKREAIGWRPRRGVLNTLEIHYEEPTDMSSWTIGSAVRIERLISGAKSAVVEDGPVVKILRFEHSFGKSSLVQDMRIYVGSPRIDVAVSADWNETGDAGREAPMLKACFTPDVKNTSATYEIPYGSVSRPCTDMEVPALRWADISGPDYGFSLLNDCKYGHRARGNSLELTLIRSGWEPDPTPDVGHHEFIYSMLPHKGAWQEGGAVREGYFLNQPLLTSLIAGSAQGSLPEEASLLKVSGGSAAVSAFKPAEAGDGLILRVYNEDAAETDVTAELGFHVGAVRETDLNENAAGGVETDGQRFSFRLGRYEIKTFLLSGPFSGWYGTQSR
ncbi:MAG: glycoside hydrolase family 38 C-terminal domain-containing protein [Clostridia bacterium]|nr:glycoside hydrolase family 38 C-terminal domain-containing protein [Clostridia bacterium]